MTVEFKASQEAPTEIVDEHVTLATESIRQALIFFAHCSKEQRRQMYRVIHSMYIECHEGDDGSPDWRFSRALGDLEDALCEVVDFEEHDS